MWQAWQSDPEKFCAATVLCALCVVMLGAVWIKAWRRNEAGKRDSELKLEMVARGMSADEIVRVLEARSDEADSGASAERKK